MTIKMAAETDKQEPPYCMRRRRRRRSYSTTNTPEHQRFKPAMRSMILIAAGVTLLVTSSAVLVADAFTPQSPLAFTPQSHRAWLYLPPPAKQRTTISRSSRLASSYVISSPWGEVFRGDERRNTTHGGLYHTRATSRPSATRSKSSSSSTTSPLDSKAIRQLRARNPWLVPLQLSSSSSSSWSPSSDNNSASPRKKDKKTLKLRKGKPGNKKNKNDKKEQEQENEEEDSPQKRWLRWMIGGKPRGTNKVILREAEELGGVPRSARYSSRDWFHTMITFPNSGVLRDTKSPVLFITGWSVFLSLVHEYLLRTRGPSTAAAFTCPLPAGPHSLMMSVLGLLLVFRTNSAYQRFVEGRKIWENIINSARDLYRMLMLYEREIGMDKRRRLQRLLAAFPYLLRHRIRPKLVKMHRLDNKTIPRDPKQTILLYQDEGLPEEDDIEAAALAETEEQTGKSRRMRRRPLFWVDRRTLPWRLLPPGGALEKCARAQNRPLWVCDRMAQEIRDVPDGPHFTNRERLALIGHVDKLSRCIGGAERIHQTVVPLNYARHTLRALTIWLVTFPLVVVKDLKLLTGPSLFLVTWMLFGIFQIGYDIEDPFQGTLRVSILCDTIRRDVLADENIRSTAFRPEYADEVQEEEEDDEEEFVPVPPPTEGIMNGQEEDQKNNNNDPTMPAAIERSFE